MTETEKESIEYLKEYVKWEERATKYGAVANPRNRIILNLIENQEKEIEELKKTNVKLEEEINALESVYNTIF